MSAAITHGVTRWRLGCRCDVCRGAYRFRERAIRANREASGDGLVSAERTRRHLESLTTAGVGMNSIAAKTGCGRTHLRRLKDGLHKMVQAKTERAILAVKQSDSLYRARVVDARPAWAMVAELVDEGFTKVEIARRLGYKTNSIPWRKRWIDRKNAERMQAFYVAIMAGARKRVRLDYVSKQRRKAA
jgi:hypothetical protein